MGNKKIMDQARATAKLILSEDPQFRSLSKEEQFEQYKALVHKEYQRLAGMSNQQALSRATVKEAGQMINEAANDTARTATGMMEDMKDAIDFPDFVKDLITGVFEANVKANRKQMDDYMDLLKMATSNLDKLMSAVSDNEAVMFLDNDPNSGYSLMPPKGKRRRSSSSSGGLTLFNEKGKPVDEKEKAELILKGKMQMAKQTQAMLREMLLMGVNRLVVEKGVIKAGMSINITTSVTGNRDIASEDSQREDEYSRRHTRLRAGGFFGLFGVSHSSMRAKKKTRLQISGQQGDVSQEIKSNSTLTGEVELNFKSDYFKMDNFAAILGGKTPELNKGEGEASNKEAES